MAYAGLSVQLSGMSCQFSFSNWLLIHCYRPLIGGTLSNPVERFPEWFGHSELLKTHPYFLPSLFAAAVAALGSIGGFFCLQEVRGLFTPASDGAEYSFGARLCPVNVLKISTQTNSHRAIPLRQKSRIKPLALNICYLFPR